jgi:PBP1b-binding outer membrane lipoprotein LpoB
MQTKMKWVIALALLLVLVALFVAACSPSYDCKATTATEFYQINATQFGLMVFTGTPDEGYVAPLTYDQVQAIANKTVYVRLVFNHEYTLCSTTTQAAP